MKKIAVYPGTFDPLTNGHVDIIRRASDLFDEVIVAVARSADKKPLFSFEERVSMAVESLIQNDKVVVKGFSGLFTDFLKEQHARVAIRGLRAVADFDYEFALAGMNRRLMSDIETVFLMPSEEHMFVSSSFVREVAAMGGEIANFVPNPVLQEWLKKNA